MRSPAHRPTPAARTHSLSRLTHTTTTLSHKVYTHTHTHTNTHTLERGTHTHTRSRARAHTHICICVCEGGGVELSHEKFSLEIAKTHQKQDADTQSCKGETDFDGLHVLDVDVRVYSGTGKKPARR